jgi:hypothetical protein
MVFLMGCAGVMLGIVARHITIERLSGNTTDSESVVVSLTVTGGQRLYVIAKPEKRIPSSGNDSTNLTVEARTVGSTTALQSTTVTTTATGVYYTVNFPNLPDGTYDFTAKGYSHLRRKKSSVAVVSTDITTVDFTNAGSNPLLCGDVNSTDGDNKVNGIDLTLIVAGLTGSSERLDLNRDGVVNGIDLTNAVANLNQVGDS